jgi:hypothetical protein
MKMTKKEAKVLMDKLHEFSNVREIMKAIELEYPYLFKAYSER